MFYFILIICYPAVQFQKEYRKKDGNFCKHFSVEVLTATAIFSSVCKVIRDPIARIYYMIACKGKLFFVAVCTKPTVFFLSIF